jgi:glycosyltransferase involved in cell wall biosynthesis
VTQGGGRKSSGRSRAGGRVTARRPPARGTHRAQATRVALLWQAPFFNFSGYGDEARAMALAMEHRCHAVTARSWGQDLPAFVDQYARSAPDRLVALHRCSNQPLGHPFLSVVHAPGYAAMRVHGAKADIARTMFESDGLPADWVGRLNGIDEVWVPSTFNAETFARAGVTVPVHVVPGGVDASAFRPGLRPLRVPGARGTVFLSVFEWAHRKGWDVMLSAWAEAFGPGDDVSLVLRTAVADGVFADGLTTDQRIDAYLESIGRARREVAPIVVLDAPLGLDDLPRLYAGADVYVSASRGEGWGRPMMEAMACRLPTVATRWSGNLDFMDDDNSMLIDIEGVVPIDEKAEFAFYRGQRWAQPSASHLSEILRRLAAEPELRSRLGARARSDIERRWQWNRVTEAVAQRVDALAGTAPKFTHARSGPPQEAAVLSVAWEGDFYARHSLALVNRTLAGRLTAGGLVAVEPRTREAPPFPSDTALEVSRMVRARPPLPGAAKSDIVVRHQWPPDLSSAGPNPLVLIQPWEFGGLPAQWVPQIARNVAEVWCPSTWVADCYVRSGVAPDRVAVVPNGVDVERYRPDGPTYPLVTNRSRRLLFVGGTIPRKGIDVLLAAYLDTFCPGDDVCLVVKAFGSSHVYRGSTIDEQLRSIASDPSTPALELIDAELSDDEVAALYRSCDVLVHPYRGEGFGLPVAEAMASGLPVVVTGYGACLDFCDGDNALLVPATVTPVQMREIGPSSIGYWWAEPDRVELGRLLRRVVDDPATTSGLGQAGRERIVRDFTWDGVAKLAQERLLALTR